MLAGSVPLGTTMPCAPNRLFTPMFSPFLRLRAVVSLILAESLKECARCYHPLRPASMTEVSLRWRLAISNPVTHALNHTAPAAYPPIR